MSIVCRVLGNPGRDNALLVVVDSGQSIHRLLFDCGERCVWSVPNSDLLALDHLFFSHLHMDHIGGFDSFFRTLYYRAEQDNIIWGPPETRRILHHRFRGFMWNLHQDLQARWIVHDIDDGEVVTSRYELAEAFAEEHDAGRFAIDNGLIVRTPTYDVTAVAMDHLTPSMAYIVREPVRYNIDTARMATLGIPPGPWLRTVKDFTVRDETVDIRGVPHALTDLRRELLLATPGESIAYLTDFIADDAAIARLAPHLHGCNTIICESQYRQCDHELARRNYHLTAVEAATIARQAEAGKLILIHLSDRYRPEEWHDMLCEARAVFAETYFPERWNIA